MFLSKIGTEAIKGSKTRAVTVCSGTLPLEMTSHFLSLGTVTRVVPTAVIHAIVAVFPAAAAIPAQAELHPQTIVCYACITRLNTKESTYRWSDCVKLDFRHVGMWSWI